MKEKTLSIIKPDGVRKNIIGEILKRFENQGLKIKALKMVCLSKKEAEVFYAIHKEKIFFDGLIDFMSRCPVVVSVLEGENAIAKNREMIGDTNAAIETIRKDFETVDQGNTVHGSDSLESAKTEVNYFFPELEELFVF